MDHYRHFYKMASDNVHAGSKGTLYHRGIAGDATASEQILPTGPTDYGLEDPGQTTAINLHQLTVSLLTHNPELFWLCCTSISEALLDSVVEAFIRTKIELDFDIMAAY